MVPLVCDCFAEFDDGRCFYWPDYPTLPADRGGCAPANFREPQLRTTDDLLPALTAFFSKFSKTKASLLLPTAEAKKTPGADLKIAAAPPQSAGATAIQQPRRTAETELTSSFLPRKQTLLDLNKNPAAASENKAAVLTFKELTDRNRVRAPAPKRARLDVHATLPSAITGAAGILAASSDATSESIADEGDRGSLDTSHPWLQFHFQKAMYSFFKANDPLAEGLHFSEADIIAAVRDYAVKDIVDPVSTDAAYAASLDAAKVFRAWPLHRMRAILWAHHEWGMMGAAPTTQAGSKRSSMYRTDPLQYVFSMPVPAKYRALANRGVSS